MLERELSAGRATRRPADTHNSRGTATGQVINLQRAAGNAAVTALVQRMGPTVPHPAPVASKANGANGWAAKAPTAANRLVWVWSPDPDVGRDQRYFCHGLTLDTYRRFEYSVFSGAGVDHALDDEHQDLGQDWEQLKSGDIVGWRGSPGVIHTATVINLPAEDRTPANVTLWTKNGAQAERADMSISEVSAIYGQNFSFWR